MAMVLSFSHCHLTKILEGCNKNTAKQTLSHLFVTHAKEILRTFPVLQNAPPPCFNGIYTFLPWHHLLGTLPELATRRAYGRQR